VAGVPSRPASEVAEPSPVLDKRVDRAQAQILVADIEPLIAHNKFAAIGRFRLLQERMAGTAVSAELAQVRRLLEEFRFDLAGDRLRQIVAGPRWQEATHD
jgi:hypothetical protein